MDSQMLKKILVAQRDLYLRPLDNVLVVLSRSFNKASIADVLRDFEHRIHQIPDVSHPGEDYMMPRNFLRNATVGWFITNQSISHSAATREMIDKGMFLISNPGITPNWMPMLDPCNVSICRKNADVIQEKIGGNVGGTIRILANDGTDISLKIPSGNWIKEVGERKGVGTNGLCGEYMTSPYDANGTYVLNSDDFLTNPINGITEKIVLVVRNNCIVEIQGGAQAEALRQMLVETRNFKAFNLAEFAIGINPGKPEKVCRSVVAEKLAGGIHIATGTNSICLLENCPDLEKFQHGRYNCGVHVDCIKFNSSVFFQADGQKEWIALLAKGELI